jgi:chromosome segregation ATPase
MAGQEVSFEDVAAAAADLQGDGQPVTLETVREALGTGSPSAIQKHLLAWRATQAKAGEEPKAEIPAALAAALGDWARQFAQDSSAGVRDALAQAESDSAALLKAGELLETERDGLLAQLAGAEAARDQALATVSERDEEVNRLNIELRDAREVAADALVGKAKDRLAIDGKEAQLADLRAQVERYVASSGADSDARLAAEMELVGARTARDNLAAEVKDLRAKLEASHAERGALRAELQVLKKTAGQG